MRALIALLCGILFGVGLILSGMTNPEKVLAFLDITGSWDPSLMFVMLGAIATAFLPFKWAKRHQQSLLGLPLTLPTKTKIDQRIIIGSVLFGAGWGLAGICPGPAVVNFSIYPFDIAWFMMAMLVGMCLFEWYERWKLASSEFDS